MTDQFEWRLSDDRKTAVLIAPTDPPLSMSFTAESLDGLLRSAMDMRARMTPEHPADLAPGQKSFAVRNPRVVSELSQDGDSLLHLRHPGYGWLHFILPKANAGKLADLLRLQVETSATPPPTNSA